MSDTRRLAIDGFEIRDGSDCYVIAEIGHNHQGDLEHAKRLVDAARSSRSAPTGRSTRVSSTSSRTTTS